MCRKPSLYPDRDYGCFICRSPWVELHHVYPSSRRAISDREGATVFLCHEHHQGRHGVHSGDRTLDRWLKEDCQRRWMRREGATEDDFRKVFYASYLTDEDVNEEEPIELPF